MMGKSMTYVIIGSSRMRDKILKLTDYLSNKGHRIDAPVPRAKNLKEKRNNMVIYFAAIETADCVVVLPGPNGYIGPNTWLEIGYAMALRKTIVLTETVNYDETSALGIKVERFEEEC